MSGSGKFIISLDFELMWGVRDVVTLEDYGENILGVRDTLPEVMALFNSYAVKATFATVGFLFAKNKKELLNYRPTLLPTYNNRKLSPYISYLDNIGENELKDPYNYASSLIEFIKNHPDQEMATHTFSHYYCLEDGQTIDQFKADMQAAVSLAKSHNIALQSLVFPRNQFNDQYLEVCKDLGITSYRGNEKSWCYGASNGTDLLYPLRRMIRFADRYLNLSGHNVVTINDIIKSEPYNIPSSRFLSPYNARLSFLERYRINRILISMTYAAKHKKVFHLWWHPHNFGSNKDENIKILKTILNHFSRLREKYSFESHSMQSLSNLLNASKDEG